MKKQIVILLFLFNCLFTNGQTLVKISNPCNNELLKKTPGLWIKAADVLFAKISKQQQQEIFNRLDAIQQFVFNVFPSPIGIDAAWYRYTTNGVFASRVTFTTAAGGRLRENLVNEIAILNFSYNAHFIPYSCGRDAYEMRRGYPGENGPQLHVNVNALGNFFTHLSLDNLAQVMQIDGLPIKMMPPVKGKWKGYILYWPEAGSGQRMVLLHREGILPYIPVTRKQYLDRCIEYIPKFYDPVIKGYESYPDPEQKAAYIKNVRQQKEEVMRHYKNELERATADSLLNSPAIIPTYLFNISSNAIFTTEAAGGKMLVIENPDYIRKDLPKYMPQLIVLGWDMFNNWWFTPLIDPSKVIDGNFPIEKLQAMIDK